MVVTHFCEYVLRQIILVAIHIRFGAKLFWSHLI